NQLNRAYDSKYLLEKVINLIREIGKFPTSNEMFTKNLNDPSFPHAHTFQRRWKQRQLLDEVYKYSSANKQEYADVLEILQPLINNRVANDLEEIQPVDGQRSKSAFVYLLKGQPGEYKIGHTNLISRRRAELGAGVSVVPDEVHRIETDDPVGVEAYWLNRFKDKRMRGEWFKLNAQDVKAFKRWKRIY
ncbi:MAG: GIY-YIG nuclease family protein, partial [Actinomycetota bacterium]